MLSLFFDVRTLTAVLMADSAIFSITMFLIWLKRKTYPGFALWTAGNVAYTLGFCLLALRDIIPDLFSVVLANVILLSAPLLYFEGTRLFRGKSNRKIFSASLIVLYAVLQYYFTLIDNQFVVRFVMISIFLAVVFGLVALELLRNVPLDLRLSYWLTGSMFALYSIFMFTRGFLIGLNPTLNDLFAPDLLQTITFLMAILLGIAWTFGFVMLNSEHLEFDLKTAQVELQRMATTDFLTGISNNRQFFKTGARELQRARRYKHFLTVLMLDIDHFKQVNDTCGHAIGDKVLKALVAICRKFLRDIDVFGRLGGEEFAILLPETDIIGGKTIAERLRSAIAETDIEAGNRTIHITISIGVTELLSSDDELEVALKRADDAMYEAKRKGRNRVITTLS